MLNEETLQQFIALAELGTLAKVAEKFHISTPTLTRTMQSMEAEFGVRLFTRTRNRIALNDTGMLAVQEAQKILQAVRQAQETVRAFDQSLNTLTVLFCAPAPLYTLVPRLTALLPGMTLRTSISQQAEIITSLQQDKCDLAVLPFKPEPSDFPALPCLEEHLGVSVPPGHELAKAKSLTFAAINGFNFLLRSELGFWESLCREKMPLSHFLVQSNDFDFRELAASSSLPCFATDFGLEHGFAAAGRRFIPLTDSEANVTFYLVAKTNHKLPDVLSDLGRLLLPRC